MEDKKQDVNSLEELVKAADSYREFFSDLANELSKALVDIKAPDKEKNTWEMKCPYEHGDEYYYVYGNGYARIESWDNFSMEISRWKSGNIFPTEQAALLEVKRRNLLTRFRAFRDECNNGWKPDWSNSFKSKYYLEIIDSKVVLDSVNYANRIATFGYFKNEEDAERAIKLFGDEIEKLFVECE